jgi:hypothetical protein
MEDGPRYAVYFVPAADTDLYRLGSAVLQYDSYAGQAVRPPKEFAGDIAEWRRITEEPRRYGFHAKLKAPFRLVPSCTEAQLVSALQSFAGLGRTPATIKPSVQMLSGFAAVLPDHPEPAVDVLAADCTTIFDAFRAPMTAQERARRLASGLNHSQIENLDRWGYPYLFADFRFHMTLTGRIESDRRDGTLATLQAIFRRVCGGRSVSIDRLALMKQKSPATQFRVLSQASLGGDR